MTIADQINRLNNAKANIKQAIENKGVEVSDSALLDEYPALISSIEVGSGDSLYETLWNAITNNNTDYQYVFHNSSCTAIDVSKLDTSNVTNMQYMFRGSQFTSLDVSNFNTSNVTNMYAMFCYCQSLESLDLSNFNTSNVTDMKSMLESCKKLVSIDLSNFNTSNVTTMAYMFQNCQSLTTLDVSNFNTSNVTTMNYMFRSCQSLTSIDVSNFDTSNVTTMSGMFSNCTSLHTLRLDNCSNATISKIITSSSFPTAAIEGVTRTIYCKEENAVGLTAPTNWVFSYVTEEEPEVPEDPPVEDIPLYVPGEFEYDTITTEVRTMVDESHDDLSYMFHGCSNLVSVNTEDWDTSNVGNMTMMFQGCTSLTQLDLSNFNTVLVWSMSSMFQGCTSLTTLNLSNWETASITIPNLDMDNMFQNCTALHTLRLDNCSNDTISKIIKSIGFPTGAISGVTRTIYCKESEVAGLTAPTNWVFSYVD